MTDAPRLKLVEIDENYAGSEPSKRVQANLIKEGRRRERGDILRKLGVQTLEDASQVAQLRQERDGRPTATEERKHVRGALGWGVVLGMPIGIVIAFALMPIVANAVSGLLHEATITGAMVSSQQERVPHYPNVSQP